MVDGLTRALMMGLAVIGLNSALTVNAAEPPLRSTLDAAALQTPYYQWQLQ